MPTKAIDSSKKETYLKSRGIKAVIRKKSLYKQLIKQKLHSIEPMEQQKMMGRKERTFCLYKSMVCLKTKNDTKACAVEAQHLMGGYSIHYVPCAQLVCTLCSGTKRSINNGQWMMY